MLALTYTPSVARYLVAPATALTLGDIRPPRLPGPGWLMVKPRLSGICGSDQALLSGKASLHLAALTSTPFVPGHEVVGEIVSGPRRGERVVVQPALGCTVRGIEPACPECASGLPALCRHTIDGAISAGLQTGYCRDAGGGWSEGLVAHESQLHAVPADLSDEDAVLVEPLACALHAAAIADPQPGEKIAIIGAGTIGLLTLAAVRRLAPAATLLAVVKHKGQEGAARRFGADDVCSPDRIHVEGARLTGARRLVGHQGRELLLGGFDRVLDCVGSGASLEQATTIARPRGRVVMVGMPGKLETDLAAAWLRELELRGAYGYEHDFPAALELARELRPGRLIDRGWPLQHYKKALEEAPRATRNGRVKTVFEVAT
ncbi:zinc-dependent alcohol dehydrogenase [Candidatus Solirubrobacter pratensis]|uniref:zinc-dependent alcohol dehydrogenase n=1 Tax=Candidatus Solirubrobacter pratensis TaxID=1298857 RepID=UPI0004239239|nr:zinc-binding dehydrogenase [Candidatus Solirubrobacter pratensis]